MRLDSVPLVKGLLEVVALVLFLQAQLVELVSQLLHLALKVVLLGPFFGQLLVQGFNGVTAPLQQQVAVVLIAVRPVEVVLGV